MKRLPLLVACAALVVVVKAEPIFTLRRFWPSELRETIAGAAKEATAVASRWRRSIGRFSPGSLSHPKCKPRAKPKKPSCAPPVGYGLAVIGFPP